MIRTREARLADHYFALAKGSLDEAREYRRAVERAERTGYHNAARELRRIVASITRVARTYHRSGLAAKRRIERP